MPARRTLGYSITAAQLGLASDREYLNAPEGVRREVMSWVVKLGLNAKDAELAAGLDRFGKPLVPVSQATREHRESAMGPADPSAPALEPSYAVSRTRLLLEGDVSLGKAARSDAADFTWGYDSHIGESWAVILKYHAQGKGRYGRIPKRDVLGLSPDFRASVRLAVMSRWQLYKLHMARGTTQRIEPAPAVPAPRLRVIGRTDYEHFTYGIGANAQAGAETSRRALAQGGSTGMFQFKAGGGQPAFGGPRNTKPGAYLPEPPLKASGFWRGAQKPAPKPPKPPKKTAAQIAAEMKAHAEAEAARLAVEKARAQAEALAKAEAERLARLAAAKAEAEKKAAALAKAKAEGEARAKAAKIEAATGTGAGHATDAEYHALRTRVANLPTAREREQVIAGWVRDRMGPTSPQNTHGMTETEHLHSLSVGGATYHFPPVAPAPTTDPVAAAESRAEADRLGAEYAGLQARAAAIRSRLYQLETGRAKGTAAARAAEKTELEKEGGALGFRILEVGRAQRALAEAGADPGAANPFVRTLAELARVDMPRTLVAATREIIFSVQKNSQDEYWAARYNRPGFVSHATGGDGRVVVYNGASINPESFAHESGHNLAAIKYGTVYPRVSTDYAAAVASGEPVPTDYGKNSIAEDFAETAKLYSAEPDRLKQIAPRRYEVFHRLMTDPDYGG